MIKSKNQLMRFFVQLSFLVFLVFAGFMHQLKGGGPDGSASVDALCPFGGIETLYKLITTGQFVDRIQTSSLILLAAVVILAVFTSRAFCGWICPLGTIQEWFGWLGRRILGRNLTMPQKLDRPMRYLKYLVLAFTAVATWVTATLVFRPYDPWVAFMHIGSGAELFEEFPFAVLILSIVLIGSFLFDRFWCKYLCPLGAFMGILGRFSLFKVFRNESSCVGCNKCNRSCQMNINVKESASIRDIECINCLKCTSACPVSNTIRIKSAWLKKYRYISSTAFAAVAIAIFFSVYLSAQFTGTWDAKGTVPVSTTAENASAEAIKGYMTLEDVAGYMHIDKAALYEKLGIPQNVPADTKLKDVGSYVPGFTPDEAKSKLEQ